jgi:UDP-2-acetamido-3-amino-2,3-dideoxy-glucuronate N-acetyltransferase
MQPRTRTGAPPRIYQPTVVLPGAKVGPDTVIGAFCLIACGAVVGAGSRIQSHTSVWDGVELGEDVLVGPSAVFTNVRHPRAALSRAPHWDRTVVEDCATIGAGAVLVAPVRVCRWAMVGAGAVVTRDVPAHAIVVGNPARICGWACVCGETMARGERRPSRARCAACGRTMETLTGAGSDAPGSRRA